MDNGDVHLMLFLLAESAASRMRELAARCTVVEVYARDTELRSFTWRKKLRAPTCSGANTTQAAFALFRGNYRWEKPVRSIGIRASGLVEADAFLQLSFVSR